MNIQTTNTPPTQPTIQVVSGGAPAVARGGLFQHEGRIWRVVQVTGSGVTGQWVPNQEVTRADLLGIGPLTGSRARVASPGREPWWHGQPRYSRALDHPRLDHPRAEPAAPPLPGGRAGPDENW